MKVYHVRNGEVAHQIGQEDERAAQHAHQVEPCHVGVVEGNLVSQHFDVGLDGFFWH
jgi:hypothetical protein